MSKHNTNLCHHFISEFSKWRSQEWHGVVSMTREAEGDVWWSQGAGKTHDVDV